MNFFNLVVVSQLVIFATKLSNIVRMKKIFLCVCCVAALLATSCTDEDPAIPDNPNHEKPIPDPDPEPEPEPSEVKVVLNELCGNKAYNGNKFIELYNAGEDAATMTGWTLRKYASDATDVEGVYNVCWRAPQGLILAADGYLVLEADQTDPKKGFNAGLSAKKEVKFELVNAEGEVVDSFIRGEDATPFAEKSLPENKEASFSRVPNGEGEFAYAVPTPGEANGEATGEIEHTAPDPEPDPEPNPGAGEGNVVLNELCGNKVYNGNKFIELYNLSDEAAAMAGWTLRKYASDATDVVGVYNICWTASEGLTIDAGGYLVLEADQTDPSKGFSAGLSAKKEVKFELVNAKGEVVDSFIRGEDATPFAEKSLPENKEASFSRVPNGEGEFAYAVPTPGEANGEATGEIEHAAATPEPNPNPNPTVANGLSYIFDLEALPEIHLEIPLEQWNTLLKEYDKDINTDAYIHCDARFIKDGEEHSFADAGLRLRGNTSRRRPEAGNNGDMHKGDNADWQHVHFMLNLRKFQKDDAHELGGVRKIHLKWCKDDPAYVREIYCYNLFRRYGIEAGIRCSYGRLWLKVEGDSRETYYGVYEMLEAIDDEYLKNRTDLFGEGEFNLWKCGWGADLKETGGSNRFVNDDDAGTGNYPYVLKTNCDKFASAKEQLIDFILKLNGKTGDSFKTWINQVTDVELLLKTYAVNVAVGMWDDYWGNMNNYYIYFNSNDKYDYKFFFIPYDYDNTLGTSNIIDAGRQDPTRWGDSSRKLISKLLEYPEYRKIYLDALRELCNDDNLFGATGSMQRIAVWQNLIRQYVPNDTGEDMVIEDRPASWSNHSEYRIMSPGSNNFFTVKKNSIPQQ